MPDELLETLLLLLTFQNFEAGIGEDWQNFSSYQKSFQDLNARIFGHCATMCVLCHASTEMMLFL